MVIKTEIHQDKTAFAQAAAQKIATLSADSINNHGTFTIALAGGSTPKLLYESLAIEPYLSSINWAAWHVFFGDERCVPLDNYDSNFKMAEDSLLAHVPIPKSQINPINTREITPELAALEYEKKIRGVQFDLILYGLGSDGHTLSLFPGKTAVKETKKRITWSPPGVLPPPIDRITMTLSVIPQNAWFLVAGADKAQIIRELADNPPSELRPASLIKSTEGTPLWLLDQASAKLLNH